MNQKALKADRIIISPYHFPAKKDQGWLYGWDADEKNSIRCQFRLLSSGTSSIL